MYHVDFKMRNHLVLSRVHAVEKRVHKRYDREELEYGWRTRTGSNSSHSPLLGVMRHYEGDDLLEPSQPLTDHLLAADGSRLPLT